MSRDNETAMKFKGINSKSPGNLSDLGNKHGDRHEPSKQMSPQNIFGINSDNLDQDIDLIEANRDSTLDRKRMRAGTFGNLQRITEFSQIQRKNTLFPREERTDALNIDESDDSDEEDLEQYQVNTEQSGRKKKYKRIYDSKYKFPVEKKLQL